MRKLYPGIADREFASSRMCWVSTHIHRLAPLERNYDTWRNSMQIRLMMTGLLTITPHTLVCFSLREVQAMDSKYVSLAPYV